MSQVSRFLVVLMLLLSLSSFSGHAATAYSSRSIVRLKVKASIADAAFGDASNTVYLPLLSNQRTLRRVNAPYLNVTNVAAERFSEMAIFWFGRVTQTENYTDVRVGYNNTDLYIYTATFDRRLWYDEIPSAADLTNWDAVTLYLNIGGPSGSAPTTTAYRFAAQFNGGEDDSRYELSYRGNGSGWVTAAIPFYTLPGWRGESLNDDGDDRGWAMTFRIAFASLGLAGPPPQGTIWGMAITLHDRDDASGTPIVDQIWPETVSPNAAYTWGQLAFGLPSYTTPPATPGGTTIIRHQLNGAMVPDAAVGGTIGNLCPGDSDYIWNMWGNANFAGAPDFNIQNQSDVADWPCFAKYYVTFPLTAVPAGKVILSATLTLYHWGNSGSLDVARPSFIQVMSVPENWNEASLTWNNAPLAQENISQAWVAPVTSCNWPCIPRMWDVSRAVAQAYATGQPVRLALYSADSDYHSGKFFTSSETGDWNEVGRPTLRVTWGDP